LIEGGQTAAESWLNDANVASALQEQDQIPIRSHGGRVAAENSVASTVSSSAAGSSSDISLPPIPPLTPAGESGRNEFVNMDDVAHIAEATGMGLSDTLTVYQEHDNNANDTLTAILDAMEDDTFQGTRSMSDDDVQHVISNASEMSFALANNLLSNNATVKQLVDQGFDVDILVQMVEPVELRLAGVPIESMYGRSIGDLKTAFTFDELMDAGYDEDDLRDS
jgi:hypothetical protein